MLSVEQGGPRRVRAHTRRPDGQLRPVWPYLDPLAVLSVVTLVALGVLNLDTLDGHSLAEHQLLSVLAGVALFVIMRRLRAASLRWVGWACYIVSVTLLLAVMTIGPSISGARRWLAFGSFTLQPSELAKIGLLLVLAQVLATEHSYRHRLGLAVLVAAVPIGLVVTEPDLSTATTLAVLTLAMLVLGAIPLRVVIAMILTVAATAPFAEHLLQPYQLARLHAFLGGSGSSSGSGWSTLQAHIALAWGGLAGQARQPMHLLKAQYLPERETDLAFASLVEQGGILAGTLAVIAASVLIWRIAAASRHARTRASALSAAGFTALISIEVLISVAANLGLLPIAGVPFPLLSYGGTAAAVHIAMVGVVLGLRADAESHSLWLAPRSRRTHPRLVRLTALAVTGSLIGMIGFVWQLQRTQGPALRAAGLTQMIRCVSVPAPRGVITDRHGTPVAINVMQDQVWVVPALVDSTTLARLATLAARPTVDLRRTLGRDPTALTVDVGTIPPITGTRLSAAHLAGVLVVPSTRRYYPDGTTLGPILGWTGVATAADVTRWPGLSNGAIVGRAGIEQQYDPILRGVDGQQCFYVDPTGQPVVIGPSRAAIPGTNLQLTLDLGLQQRVTTELAAALRGVDGQPPGDLGGAVVMDPKNGQVLAMASLPAYNDNIFEPPMDEAAVAAAGNAAGNAMLEHVTQSVAPPGSTFKLVVSSAEVTRPVVPVNEIVPTGYTYTLDGHTFHNWTTLPPQNLVQALAWSNDVYFYKLANALGPAAIVAAAHRLGVAQPTGIDLPGEYSGYLGTPSTVSQVGGTWYSGSTVLLGIGQGYLDVTPLQDARWTAAVATGATITPHLGLAFSSDTDSFTALPWPQPEPLAFAGSLGPVRDGMRLAVTDGTATTLDTLPVPAAGKTGTAQDATAPYSATDSWLSAVAPSNNPAIEVTSFIHGGGEGSTTSGEVVRTAMAYFFAHERAIVASVPAGQ